MKPQTVDLPKKQKRQTIYVRAPDGKIKKHRVKIT
ncbi:hypothetical protein SPSPH_003340 [Sporomusa sphaeroides DSM 2875]|uniref:Uncharacterized protein n=1 Tax=Sporomusa sphaeroides DSM 2875 TaxID=1337886 RepID=A0ABM9W1I1_9FIRM|nr:hypothetical protein SPSPH_03030 [Sporomusa sphaeroides DSM 2875]CVK18760.1 hypothetical protein SSPH_01404 [Sporomusa sphaeroides DSM 2875]